MINRIRVVTLLVMVLGVFALLQLSYSLFPAVCFFLPFTIARRALWFPINYGNSRAS